MKWSSLHTNVRVIWQEKTDKLILLKAPMTKENSVKTRPYLYLPRGINCKDIEDLSTVKQQTL